MKKNPLLLCSLLAFALIAMSASLPSFADPVQNETETLIMVRHGEKTPHELGQLSCRGLNRSLALPDVLIGKYGKPGYIFAPDPSDQIGAGKGQSYSYVRPFATIEPTAIRLGMPVNTQIGFNHIDELQTELAKPIYANSTIFIAWEHGYEDQFAKNIVKTYGGDPATVPDWPGDDYDSIFVIHIQRNGDKTTETFKVDHEGLNDKLSDKCPTAASNS